MKQPFDNSPAARLCALEDWFDTGFGQHVLAAERELADARLPALFGFHLMQLGISRRVPLYGASAVRHRFQLARMPGGEGVGAVGAHESLPLEADSIDVALLHHALEYSPNPHQLLREAARVVVPHGHVIVIGFNPWSLFGLCAVPGRRFGHPVWQSRLLGARRVCDWLALLDFAVDSVQYRVFAPPVEHRPTLERSAVLERVGQRLSLPFGAVYLIHARKQQGAITPVRSLRWRAPRLPGVVLPATRSRNPTIH